MTETCKDCGSATSSAKHHYTCVDPESYPPVDPHPRQYVTHEDLHKAVNDHVIRMAAVVRSGDTLVLALAPYITPSLVDKMRNQFEKTVPNLKVVFLSGVESMAVQLEEDSVG